MARLKSNENKEDETIKDLQPIVSKYFNDKQLNELRYYFYMENAPEPHKLKIEALVYSSDGNIMIKYTQQKVFKTEMINRH